MKKISERKLFEMVNKKLAQLGGDVWLAASESEEERREFGYYYLVEFARGHDPTGMDLMVTGSVAARHVTLGVIAGMLGLLVGNHDKYKFEFGPSDYGTPQLSEATLVAKGLLVIEDDESTD